MRREDHGRTSGYRHKGQLKSQSSGPNYVEKRGGTRARVRLRAQIYNKMKAIRGDNPRTTNQRVYLMPVMPPPPPEKLPTPDVKQFSLSFPPFVSLFHIVSFLLSVYLSISLLVPRIFSLSLSLSHQPPLANLLPLSCSLLSFPRHRVVTLGYVTMLPT